MESLDDPSYCPDLSIRLASHRLDECSDGHLGRSSNLRYLNYNATDASCCVLIFRQLETLRSALLAGRGSTLYVYTDYRPPGDHHIG